MNSACEPQTALAMNPAFADPDVTTAFRTAMRTVTGTVMLVTARTATDEWRGMAATAFASVAMEPPTCLVCINRASSVHPAIIETGRFCVNVMHQDHHDLIPSFAKPECRDARFRTGPWRVGTDGLPYLETAQSSLFCRLAECVFVGTHDVIIGNVFAVVTRPDFNPLLYGDRTYLKQTTR